eukprot:TRINITY_DN7445_c2_g1_i1.p2 TRINITY_DN7445_c2_g1~~TRINITY_DN7445_c2_g1_i1.p2  ORF type:complete len:466 (-),score=179.86 TRINITY_DN7445_c2_g1_i1:195-1592(-)
MATRANLSGIVPGRINTVPAAAPGFRASYEFAADASHPLQQATAAGLGASSELRVSDLDTSEFFGVGVGTRARLSAEDVRPNIDGIRELMRNGCWRPTHKLSERLLQSARHPHYALQLRLCAVLALVKMRQFKHAADELAKVGDFDSPENCFEKYPEHYPGLRGSMVPFALRVVAATLPYHLKTSQSLDPLYELLAVCRRQLAELRRNEAFVRDLPVAPPDDANLITVLPVPSGGYEQSLPRDGALAHSFDELWRTWSQRETMLLITIATRLVQERELPLAIQTLSAVLAKHPGHPRVLSCLGRVHLQMGNVKVAAAVFKQLETQQPPAGAESAASESASDVPPEQLTCLVNMNRGFLALAMEQYVKAIDAFQAVLDLDPDNVSAANNKAISLLYTCHLTRAISSLEELIRRDPEQNLHETVVFNLCTLYDLKSENSSDKKKAVMALVAKNASDSFDFGVLKIAP